MDPALRPKNCRVLIWFRLGLLLLAKGCLLCFYGENIKGLSCCFYKSETKSF